MAVENPPISIQAGSHSAEQDRRAISALLGGKAGILTPADLLVAQRGAGVNMSVDVATGQVAVAGTEATYQGLYLVENRGTLNVAIAASDPTNARRDLIVVRVRDAAYSGATNTASIEAVTGTPAASPVDPALPSGSCFVLARVTVAAGATSISTGNITDLRRTYVAAQYGLMTAAGGTIICTSTTRPTSPFEGMRIYEIDTDLTYVYNGSAWFVPGALGRIASTVRTSNSVTFSSVVYPNSVGANLLPNRRIRVRVHVNLSSTVAGTNVSIGVANNAGTILNQAYCTLATANASQQMTVEYETTSGAGGSTTFQISAFTAANTAVITGSGAAASYITVFDDGPV